MNAPLKIFDSIYAFPTLFLFINYKKGNETANAALSRPEIMPENQTKSGSGQTSCARRAGSQHLVCTRCLSPWPLGPSRSLSSASLENPVPELRETIGCRWAKPG